MDQVKFFKGSLPQILLGPFQPLDIFKKQVACYLKITFLSSSVKYQLLKQYDRDLNLS